MKKILSIILIFAFLLGCLGSQDCKNDKECLRKAFASCQQAYGTWEGQNGDIKVAIIGKKDTSCEVGVQIISNGLNITNKNMNCYLPMTGNSSFEISGNCSGELKSYFS